MFFWGAEKGVSKIVLQQLLSNIKWVGPSGGPSCWVEKSLSHENLERSGGKFFVLGVHLLRSCFFIFFWLEFWLMGDDVMVWWTG